MTLAPLAPSRHGHAEGRGVVAEASAVAPSLCEGVCAPHRAMYYVVFVEEHKRTRFHSPVRADPRPPYARPPRKARARWDEWALVRPRERLPTAVYART